MKHLSRYQLSLIVVVSVAMMYLPASTGWAQGRPISLPPQATEIAQGLYYLGTARDADGRLVEGVAFVDYKKGFVRPERPGGSKPPKESSCYAFLGSGAKWKSVEPCVVDLDAPGALGIANAIATWEAAAGCDIIGDVFSGPVSEASVGTMNGVNEVMFGILEDPDVIAMTTVWGVFGGPPAGRELVEWDMVFGPGWTWNWWYAAEEPNVTAMDFLSIATHEIGHAVGMDHPRDTCTEETMYAYADWRETKKRDLNSGDIAGIQKLYR